MALLNLTKIWHQSATSAQRRKLSDDT